MKVGILTQHKSLYEADNNLLRYGKECSLRIYYDFPRKIKWLDDVGLNLRFDNIEREEVDILYVRIEHYFELMKNGILFKALGQIKYSKLVLGLHCIIDEQSFQEERLVAIADAYVFPNDMYKNYFEEKYGGVAKKPIFYNKSMWLPLYSYYEKHDSGVAISDNPYSICVPGTKNLYSTGSGRWDYFDVINILNSCPMVNKIGVFGQYHNEKVRDSYEKFNKVESIGLIPENSYVDHIKKYDFALLNGHMNNDISLIEKMNYQARYNAILAAGCRPLCFEGASEAHEVDIRSYGFGLTYKSFDDLISKLISWKAPHDEILRLEQVRRSNSLETYDFLQIEFFRSLLKTAKV